MITRHAKEVASEGAFVLPMGHRLSNRSQTFFSDHQVPPQSPWRGPNLRP